MTPDRFTGAWRRTSIAVDGADPVVGAEVRWVQAGDHYADLRIPVAPEEPPVCFAGTTTWDDPDLRWAHELDLDPAGGEDVGAITDDGDDLVETGSFERDGRTVPYVERWERLAGGDGAVLALERADVPGLLVMAGDHAVAVVDERADGGPFLACSWRHHRGSWHVDLCLDDGYVGEPALDLCLDGPLRDDLASGAGGSGVELGGRTWRVVDARPAPTAATH